MKRFFHLSITLFFTLFVTHCTNAAPLNIEGVWASEGYGRVVEIGPDTINSYDVTKISCVLRKTYPRAGFMSGIDRINVTDKKRFSYYSEGAITRYSYTKLSSLPGLCRDAKTPGVQNDPLYNFDVFWHSFNDHYAFFETHQIDWKGVYKKFRPLVTKDMTPEELHNIFVQIISQMNDRHVRLKGWGDYQAGTIGTLKNLYQKELPPGQKVDRPLYRKFLKRIIARDYLKNSKKEALHGEITWGWAAKDIGYLSVDTMCCYKDVGDKSLTEQIKIINKIMDDIIGDFSGAKAVIVDARWNEGGYDAIALHIASHFTDQRLLAFTKKAKKASGYTPVQEIFIPDHTGEVFTGPTVFLTTRDTLSAAEIFAMAMMAIPNVTTMGERTSGSLSDVHSVVLPNGWKVQMSNELYTAVDGGTYEGKGIPVDIEVTPNHASNFEDYLRLPLDRAIVFLNNASD